MGNEIDLSSNASVHNYVLRDIKANGVAVFVDVVYRTDKKVNIYEKTA